MNRPARPEVLAPAGDPDALRAAIQAGADAVYFGLQGFNARARATNFDAASLRDTMDLLHAHGVRGYVTLNTLVFDAELPPSRPPSAPAPPPASTPSSCRTSPSCASPAPSPPSSRCTPPRR
jgi:hypothetical protein